jgi:hemoglobin/transferrin/lactoferrin receptor protein
MIKFIAVFLFSLISATLSAQVLQVFDEANGLPLSGVVIFDANHIAITKTDKEGKGILAQIKSTDTLGFEALGFRAKKLTLLAIKQNNYRVFLTESQYTLNEIVVSASRFEEKKSDVPQRIESINSKSIAFLNQPNTADLLQQAGNILVQKSQAGGGSPVVRGFEANKILMVVDGVRMNNAIYRGGHLQNVLTVDQNILANVEVVFGPASVVYGSDALGGVIHFFSKKPELGANQKWMFKANVLKRWASATAENTSHIDLNFGFEKIAFLSSFTYSDFGDLKQGKLRGDDYPNFGKRLFYQSRINGRDSMMVNADINLQKSSGYRQFDFLQKLLFKHSNRIEHGLNLQYSSSSNINRYDRLTEYNGTKFKYAEWYYGPQNRFLTAYHLQLKSNRKLWNAVKIVASYQALEESRMSRKFRNNNLESRIENVNVFSLNADAAFELKNHEIRYGSELSYNDVASNANSKNIVSDIVSPLSTRYPDGGSSMSSFAFYATHSWEFSPKLIFVNGLRYSHINLNAKFDDKTFFPFPFNDVKQNSRALTGNIGLNFLPDQTWKISFLAASGFRAPNVDDLAKVFESVPGKIIIPNPNLKSEYTYNADFNITKVIIEKINFSSGVYYTWYKNAITVLNSTFNGQSQIIYDGQLSQVTTNVNQNKAFIYGFYGQLKAQISPDFQFFSTLNYTYGRSKAELGNLPLDHIPPLFGKTSLFFQKHKANLELSAQYNGWKKLKDYSNSGEDNLTYATATGMPSWLIFNLRSSYQIAQKIQIQASIENIFDQNYRVFASGISSAGRNLSLTLRGNF